MLQFDVCCKAIDQNFDCGCDHYAILRLDTLPTYGVLPYAVISNSIHPAFQLLQLPMIILEERASRSFSRPPPLSSPPLPPTLCLPSVFSCMWSDLPDLPLYYIFVYYIVMIKDLCWQKLGNMCTYFPRMVPAHNKVHFSKHSKKQ